jgi:hypothetical protein
MASSFSGGRRGVIFGGITIPYNIMDYASANLMTNLKKK